ncbi:MAG TPA: aminoacyl-tRNA hydrolase [Gammaproteobacteria bacterium]|nr:aminoacyl-tRNA hydrolase [Gammaproteobacteria bacterium]
MNKAVISLIAGLGNPGNKYKQTRHNAGFWFLDALASEYGADLRTDDKFHGETAKIKIGDQEIWLLKPDTFMNLSGQAIAAISRFYKIPAEEVLVVHDELDLPPGTARLKRDGGHGGHNGLRDTIEKLGSKEFARLRLGIGHPGDKSRVHDYVLHQASRDDQIALEIAIRHSTGVISEIVSGDWDKAMNQLHTGS